MLIERKKERRNFIRQYNTGLMVIQFKYRIYMLLYCQAIAWLYTIWISPRRHCVLSCGPDLTESMLIWISPHRHCVLSCGPDLTESMWYVTVTGIKAACHISLYSLQQLMTPFLPNSDNFYGDIGHVKVAVRKDQTEASCDRLCQLAHQVNVNLLC